MNYIKIILSCLFVVLNMLSCSNNRNKYRKELETTQKFLKYASRADSLNIQKLIGMHTRYTGDDREGINFNVEKISKLFKKYGIPDEQEFKFREYPSSEYKDVDIIIPILNSGNGNLKNAKIIIYFFKYLGTNKIGYFDVITNYSTTPTIAPDSTNIIHR